jgi:phytoene desaturase
MQRAADTVKEATASKAKGQQVENYLPPAACRLPITKSAIIIGAGLGGLSAAIHLRLAGYTVTILESNPKVGGRANVIEEQGFRFDTGPSLLNYPWVFEELFKAAGRSFYDYVELIKIDPSVSFEWTDGTRFTLSSDLGKLMEECERVEPGSRTGLLRWLRDADIKYRMSFDKLVTRNEDNPINWFLPLSLKEIQHLSVWRSLYGELRRFFKSRYIPEALGAYGMYLGGSPYDLPGLFSILAYGELAYGLWLPRGGIYGVVEAIEKLAQELGVQIHISSRVSKVLIETNRAIGVELSSGDIHRADVVVSNVDVPTTNSSLIGDEAFTRRATAKATRTRMSPGVLTFYWGIRGKVDNLGHHTIFLPDNYRAGFDDLFKHHRIPQQLPFYISVPSESDASLAPAGDSAMFVLAPTPLLSQMPNINWTEATARVKTTVLARLQQHGVQLDSSRIIFEKVFTPEEWSRRFGLYDGSAFGAAHGLFEVGPFRARNYSREIAGLYYTGASTTPGTGMPMVLLSGKLVAERILEREKQKSGAGG